MRGNHAARAWIRAETGSIPAHAGEPGCWQTPSSTARVYPRPCGGTACILAETLPLPGLSPPMRGNRRFGLDHPHKIGSIPAHAGEPSSYQELHILGRVYPRPCGGTRARGAALYRHRGLSPPMRGNRHRHDPVGDHAGSIPARAGEPASPLEASSLARVYPRPCGGTRPEWSDEHKQQGLSPPVRGNPCPRASRGSPAGSIPARAGEPPSGISASGPTRVYPRPCGGTASIAGYLNKLQGLSPPVRGNRLHRRLSEQASGSIPARAGEPASLSKNKTTTRVYPRPCGGTGFVRDFRGQPESGLSPPVRGNQIALSRSGTRVRSIPARAGEPASSVSSDISSGVYPRPCGGT